MDDGRFHRWIRASHNRDCFEVSDAEMLWTGIGDDNDAFACVHESEVQAGFTQERRLDVSFDHFAAIFVVLACMAMKGIYAHQLDVGVMRLNTMISSDATGSGGAANECIDDLFIEGEL